MSDCEYKRKIEPHPATARVIAENISEKSLGDPRKWLEEINRAEKFGAKFLLAHAEDGVIWGAFDVIRGVKRFQSGRAKRLGTRGIAPRDVVAGAHLWRRCGIVFVARWG